MTYTFNSANSCYQSPAGSTTNTFGAYATTAVATTPLGSACCGCTAANTEGCGPSAPYCVKTSTIDGGICAASYNTTSARLVGVFAGGGNANAAGASTTCGCFE